ncbi:MAG TPA: hypothetical protein VFX02_11790, partial [Gammaproteobacteria bacterium]|nr:hypothetical protein [Gammaproteobacteria bacterium]
IGNIEVMKKQEGALIYAPACVVRLQRLEHCQCCLFDAPLLQLSFSTVKAPSILKDREIGIGGVFDLPSRETLHKDGFKEVVERASCVVNAVPDQEGPLKERGMLVNSKPKSVLPRLSIRFLDNGISFSIFRQESVYGRLKSAEVYLRPLNLRCEA